MNGGIPQPHSPSKKGLKGEGVLKVVDSGPQIAATDIVLKGVLRLMQCVTKKGVKCGNYVELFKFESLTAEVQYSLYRWDLYYI